MSDQNLTVTVENLRKTFQGPDGGEIAAVDGISLSV